MLLAWLSPCALASDILFTNALVIGSVGRTGRTTTHTDAIEAQVVSGEWRAPQAQDIVVIPGGQERVWESATANKDGWFEHRAFRGGYAFASVQADQPRVMILDAAGHSAVYVNGEIRTGDPYAHGYLRLPVWLDSGTNEFLFHVSRGRFRARLTEPKASVLLNLADTTLPDLVIGELEPAWAGVVVLNATTNPTSGLYLQVAGASDKPENRFPIDLPSLAARKVAFAIPPPQSPVPGDFSFDLNVIETTQDKPIVLETVTLKVGVRQPTQLHRRTFTSRIDGSVQYYAVNPPPIATEHPALFLSLHGAGVEAGGQAASYAPKSWGLIVSPTNRRPYGFDWEEWGRWDALEVLALALERYRTDPTRTYLTGHSMGGHGTWSIGLTFPDRFAAIAPSAGWISFRTYARAGQTAEDDSPMQELLRRAAASSDTLSLVSNALHHAVCILHGDADDNVPVSEARAMRERLGQFHRDFTWHEQAGAGHWWDASDEPGTDCVDWAPMFDLFARRRIPASAETRAVQFTTVNPGVSSRCRWLAIEAQQRQLDPSHVDARCDPGRRRIVARTVNVARLSFQLEPIIAPGAPIDVELDGQRLDGVAWSAWTTNREPAVQKPGESIAFERGNEHWQLVGPPDPTRKNTVRYGPFREAFNNRMLFVYATRGTDAGERLGPAPKPATTPNSSGIAATARSMSSQTPPTSNIRRSGARPADRRMRNVILYGHADSNAAWPDLLGQSPVQVSRGVVRVGSRELRGDDLGVLFLRPYPGDPAAMVGVVAGSGLSGMRVTDRLPVFVSGSGLPDCLVVGADMLARGVEGVRAAGFFGNDWTVDAGEFVWSPNTQEQ